MAPAGDLSELPRRTLALCSATVCTRGFVRANRRGPSPRAGNMLDALRCHRLTATSGATCVATISLAIPGSEAVSRRSIGR